MMDIGHEMKAIQEESDATKQTPLPPDAVGEQRGRSVVRTVRLPEPNTKRLNGWLKTWRSPSVH